MNILRRLLASLLFCIVPALLFAQSTLVPEGEAPYQASVFPDRILLLPTASPATSQTINWRTSDSVDKALAEITEAHASPGLHLTANRRTGVSRPLEAGNGAAHHHSVTFDGLTPDTLYAYRVRGDGTWSEWFQFRTAADDHRPHTAIYFGDAQNSVKSHFSRTIREAYSSAPRAQVMVHAGDMVNSRSGKHDDEWGEWFDAGSWINSMVNNVFAVGNHEYIKQESGPRLLSPHVPVQFATPGNGPDPLRDTVYYTDYQGVRYIVLNSMEALQNEELAELQADWLRKVLENNPARWTVVIQHHPVFSVSRGRDNPPLRQHWKPVFEKYGVDLVLQGHDHSYGRGRNLSTGSSGKPDSRGPMYVVSVAGPKMYLLTESAKQSMDRLAEDTQLFQLITFEADSIEYRAITANGILYDAFDMVRQEDGSNEVIERKPDSDTNLCGNPNPPPSRCWNGIEFVE